MEDTATAIYPFKFTVPRKWKTGVLCKSEKGIKNNARTTTKTEEYNLQAAASRKREKLGRHSRAVQESILCLRVFGWWASCCSATSHGCTWQQKGSRTMPRLCGAKGIRQMWANRSSAGAWGVQERGDTSGYQQDTAWCARHYNWIGTWQDSAQNGQLFSCVVPSLTVAAQSPEWWCRWSQTLNASSVPIMSTSLHHLFVTDGAAIIHPSSPVLLLLSLQLAIHFMWPKKHSSTPGSWPLCQRGWCVNALG